MAIEKDPNNLTGLFDIDSFTENMLDAYALHKIILDDNGNPIDYVFLAINKNFELFTGISKEKALGKKVTEIFPHIKKDSFDWIGIYGKVALTGEPARFEQKFETNSRYYKISAFSPKKYYFAVLFEDISQNKTIIQKLQSTNQQLTATEQQLRASNQQLIAQIQKREEAEAALTIKEERYRTLVENLSSGVCVYQAVNEGEDFIIIAFNKACENIEQIKSSYVVGRKVTEVFPGVIDFGIFDCFKRVWKTGISETFPVGIYEDERITGWRENNVYKLPSGEVVAVYDDLTLQKQAEHELKKHYNLLETIMASSQDSIYVKDLHGRYLFANQAALKTLDVKKEACLGKTDIEILGNDIGASIMQLDKNIINSRERPVVEEKIIIDGKETVWSSIKAPYIDKDNKCIGIIGISRDITEKKLLDEELQRNHKLESVGVLAGGIAHDFNNYLNGILGNISLVEMLFDKDREKAFSKLKESERILKEASSLTHQLLTFSKGGKPIKESILITKLVKESAIFASSGSNVSIKFDFAPDIKSIIADKGQVKQAIQNLTLNAIQATMHGEDINISVQNIKLDNNNTLNLRPGEYVKISIKDKGCGISDENLSKIFDPYFTTKTKGQGLGLAIVYSIIKNHEGNITVESKLNAGSIFSIYLPASEHEVLKTTNASDSKNNIQAKIIVMDDEKFILDLFASGLKQLGFEVFTVSNAESLMNLLNTRQHFDLAILDLTVKGSKGGKEVIADVKKLYPNIKTIAFSGYSNDPVISDPLKFGFDAAISKPCTPVEVGTLIKIILS